MKKALKSKSPHPDKLTLDVMLGNNLDKIKAVHYLVPEQIVQILQDLFSRPEQLKFSDCESQ